MLKMKYQQFLMRLFDCLIDLFKKNDMLWYARSSLGFKDELDRLKNKIYELELDIHERDREIDRLNYHLTNLYEENALLRWKQ